MYVVTGGAGFIGSNIVWALEQAGAGAVDDVVATWREVLGDRATVLRREEAIGRGWFGAVGTGVLPRIGDVVAACHGDHAILSTAEWGYEATLVGLHGSLTPEEMLIPVLVD